MEPEESLPLGEGEDSPPVKGRCRQSRQRGTGLLDHEVVDEGNLYHSFYGTRCQFYVMQICSISRVVEGADPYKEAIKFL